eukprot:CAMPEP_0181294536 /NCGR_PEP_ID=MMETSP1101-20121128/3655_1 /TAXON_ID=46948 /ORGANISM="Rhodomonas abbreviata, Strain Caron Lab Isolate" /LENGTH=434 /DNA_ID=CAMNT_0023399205 /DNA_START=228 /DNA_END=1529 /DNA_ORIENTATION=+
MYFGVVVAGATKSDTAAEDISSQTKQLATAEEADKSTLIADYLQEQDGFELPPAAPFLGEQWVEALENVFDRMCKEWAETQEGPDADDTGFYHPRSGERHLNPAFDLTSSGTTENLWSQERFAAYLREKGEANGTMWDEMGNQSADLPRHWGDGDDGAERMRSPADHAANASDKGFSMAIEGSMDANTDPWFRANQDTNTSTDIKLTHWIDQALEDHYQAKLAQFEQMCREETLARENNDTSYLGGIKNSENPEDDRTLYNFIARPGSLTMENRRRTANFASNKWVENDNCLPNSTWTPGSAPLVWGFRADTSETLGALASPGDQTAASYSGYTGFTVPGGDENHEFQERGEDDDDDYGGVSAFVRTPLALGKRAMFGALASSCVAPSACPRKPPFRFAPLSEQNRKAGALTLRGATPPLESLNPFSGLPRRSL